MRYINEQIAHCLFCRRFVQNDSLLFDLVSVSNSLEGTRWAIGGNAPVMASRFATEGCQVLLGAKMTSRLQEQMPDQIKCNQNY